MNNLIKIKDATLKDKIEKYLLHNLTNGVSTATLIRYISEAKRRFPDWVSAMENQSKLQKDAQVDGEADEERLIDYDATQKGSVKTTIISPNKDLRNEDLAVLANLNYSLYEVAKVTRGAWSTPMKIKKFVGKDKKTVIEEAVIVHNWKYEIIWKLRDIISSEEMAKVYTDAVSQFKPGKISIIPHSKGSFMVEPAIADVHMGRLSHKEETCGENYDSKIARNRYLQVNQTFANEYKSVPIDLVVLPRGNDQLNCNDMSNVTQHGTPQDEDSRWYKVFRRALDAEIQAIEIWRQIAPVKYIAVLSNHDWERFFYLVECLRMYYKNAKDVEILNSPRAHTSVRFGATLINFSHQLKEKNADSLILHDNMDNLTGVKYTEFHTAHFHNEKILATVGGTIVRWLASLAEPSKWESDSEYRARPQAQSFLWHENDGLTDIKQIHRFDIPTRSFSPDEVFAPVNYYGQKL